MNNFETLLDKVIDDSMRVGRAAVMRFDKEPDWDCLATSKSVIIERDNILVKALKSIVACEDNWGGAEMQELAEKALRDIGEI